jgi:5-methylcytosine-specific restriction endonuclease McrA
MVVDHIVSEASGGETEIENLCLACHSCNEFKGARVASEDPMTGKTVALYHPRRQRWADHFRWSWDGGEVVGTTAIGRATVAALKMNHPIIVQARRRWGAVGWHPPAEDL